MKKSEKLFLALLLMGVIFSLCFKLGYSQTLDTMKIIKIDVYRDGGTLKIQTTCGTFYRDGRIDSGTKGQFFYIYPDRKIFKRKVKNKDIIERLKYLLEEPK